MSIDKQFLGSEAVRAFRARGVHATICGVSVNDSREIFFQPGADTIIFKPFPSDPDATRAELTDILASG